MLKSALLGSSALVAAMLFAPVAKAQDIAPATPSFPPCQWVYSFVNGVATATYCGQSAASGGLSIPKALTLNGSIYNGGDPNPVFQGLSVEHTIVTGTDSVDTFLIPYNSIFVDQDNAALTGGANAAGVAFAIYNNFGGSTMKGSRAGIYVSTIQTATTGNMIQGSADQYTAGAFDVFGTANDNGTAPTYAGSLGAFTALNPICQLLKGATNEFACQVMELDVAVASGASTYKKVGMEIVKLANDAVQGTVDAGIIFDDYAGAPGWKYGISFGSNQPTTQFPLTSASTMIGCAGNCGTVGYGVDLSNVTIANYAFRSPGFNVSGNGFLSVNPGVVGNSGSVANFIGNDGIGQQGGQIQQANSQTGATAPNKYLRVAQTGDWQIVNSAYSAIILDLSDAGALSVASAKLTAIPTSAGSGGLYVCVDTTGATYKKASCP